MTEGHAPLRTNEELAGQRQVISVETLPDDVLLAMFRCYLNDDAQHPIERGKAWQSLVHVCRRWRRIIFASPRHLNLQLVCQERTPTRDMLDVWPALPLVIWCHGIGSVDNIIAVLEQRDRVCQINLWNVKSSDLGILLAAIQQPFPELRHLSLHSLGETVPVVPDSFLGGSAPRLEFLQLNRIPIPGLLKLILSATHLVDLYLTNIPHSVYISPEAIVTTLSMLNYLEELSLQFQSPRSCPDQASRRLPPSSCSALSVLRTFIFKGVSEYLEDLLARIDAPRLNTLEIAFFNDIAFDTPQFTQFVGRTPMSGEPIRARIVLRNVAASINLFQASALGQLKVKILCRGLDWQLSSLEQLCTSCLPSLSKLEDLYIYEDPDSQPLWKDDIENGLWLQLLHPFTAVKNLFLSEQFALRVEPALQVLTEGRTMEVLPALQNIFLDRLDSPGPAQEGIGTFVAARRVASHPITVSSWANSDTDKVYYY